MKKPRRKGNSNTPAAQEMLRSFKAHIFRALSHPTRIHILEILKGGEHSVSALLKQLSIEQSNASQHLAVLKSRNLVTTRKHGNQIYYSLSDPLLADVLDSLKGFFQGHLEESMQILRELE